MRLWNVDLLPTPGTTSSVAGTTVSSVLPQDVKVPQCGVVTQSRGFHSGSLLELLGQMCLWVGPSRQYSTEYLHCSEALSLACLPKSVFLTAFSQTSACLGITWALENTDFWAAHHCSDSVCARPENLHFWPGRNRGRRDCLLCGCLGSKLGCLWSHCRDGHTRPSCQP